MTGDLEAILEVGSVAAVEIAASALAERGTKTVSCANCTHPLLGAYCAVCGQPANTHRRSVRALLHDFFIDLVNFDSRILRTARALLFQPGELPRAFRQGRTQPYVPSIRLYLFVSLVFFVLLGVTGIAIMQIQVTAKPVKVTRDAKGNYFIPNPAYDKDDADDPDMKKFVPPLIKITKEKAERPGGVFQYGTNAYFFARIGSYHSGLTKAQAERLITSGKVEGPDKEAAAYMESGLFRTMDKLASDPAALNGPLTTWIPRALFLLVPIYALLLALFYIRRRKDYFLVDHLVFSLSIHTFLFVVLIAAVGLAQIVAGQYVAMLSFAVLSIYIFIAMKRFYGQGWFLTTVKFLLVSGIYCVFCLLPAFAAVLALSVFGGNLG
ncbi:MAG TPA: DUF3667 domain-containing protein [Rhizomicrobium sp.]|jgi:hypothetical protein|nr:DUF3667 domain-containing protein [Rhizomicrobium sp.]